MKDEEIAEVLRKDSEEYRKLEEERKDLKALLAEIDRKLHLTADEEIERKKLQKLKLTKKDRMAELIRDYRKGHTN
jgi:hypothetical protein